MDTTRRCRESSTITPGAVASGLYRTVLHLFPLLAGALLCGQSVAVFAATAPAESANSVSDSPAASAKRPLPSRGATTDQTPATVAEKKSGGSETNQSSPPEKKTAVPAPGVIKPLPLRSTTPDRKLPAVITSEEKQPPAGADVHVGVSEAGEKRPLPLRSLATGQKPAIAAGADDKIALPEGSAATTSAGRSVAEPSTGEKRPLPTRTVAAELKRPLDVNADEKILPSQTTQQAPAGKKGEGPSSSEKRPLPARTVASDSKLPLAAMADEKKLPVSESAQPAAAEKKAEGPSNGEKRPLPLRTVAQEQDLSTAVKPEAKRPTEIEADRTGAGDTQSSSSLTGLKRPLPSRSLTREQKTPAGATAEGKKPLEAAQRQPGPVENRRVPVATEKRPLPLRTALIDQKTATSANVDVTKLSAPVKTPSAAAENTTAPAATVQKTAAVVKKPLPRTEPAAAKPELKSRTEAGESSAGNWTVMVGNYLLESALNTDLAKVKKAGFTGLVKPGDRKKTNMSRLLLAEFNDRGAAQAALDKLKRHTEDAFILDQGGVHAVFAGSYLLDSRAASEKERLGAAGFKLTLKNAEVAIPSKNLSAGSFKDKKSAEAARDKLKAAGITATLVQ